MYLHDRIIAWICAECLAWTYDGPDDQTTQMELYEEEG